MVNTSQTFDVRADALRVAKLLGCDKVHETEKGWRPCSSSQALAILIKKGEKAHALFHAREGQKARRHIVDPELADEKRKAPKRKKASSEGLGTDARAWGYVYSGRWPRYYFRQGRSA